MHSETGIPEGFGALHRNTGIPEGLLSEIKENFPANRKIINPNYNFYRKSRKCTRL
jgi:hypothetical protein